MSMDGCISALATAVGTELKGKQAVLVSGTDIKTVNGTSLLGSGNLVITGGGGAVYTAGNGIDLTGDVIAVTAACDTKWSTDTVGSNAICVITENSKTGYGTCYRTSNPDRYGDIGSNAVDLSYSDGSSTIRGATGDYSTAIGFDTTASGSGSLAIGCCTIAAVGTSFAAGACSLANCWNSAAIGYKSNACGWGSFAFGHELMVTGSAALATGCCNISYGTAAIATGIRTRACGYSSTTMGESTVAIGNYAVATGFNTKACGIASTSMGTTTRTFNSNSVVLGSCTQIGSTSTKMFAIGDGTDVQATTTNDYNIHFSVDCGGLTCTKQLKIVDGAQGVGKVLTSDANGLTCWITPSGGGAAAICVITGSLYTGYGTCYRAANPANYGDIGDKAIDLSYSGSESTTVGAIGDYSFAVGYNVCANGANSIAIGSYSSAECNFSTSIGGSGNRARAEYSAVIGGYNNTAEGMFSTATGMGTLAAADYSTAMGFYTRAGGNASTAMGYNTRTFMPASVVIGQCTQIGNSSAKIFAVGYGTDDLMFFNLDYNVKFSIDTTGSVCIIDGTQGAGKVLTSDAVGKACWATPAAGGTTYTAGLGISLASNAIAVVAACDTKWNNNSANNPNVTIGGTAPTVDVGASALWICKGTDGTITFNLVEG